MNRTAKTPGRQRTMENKNAAPVSEGKLREDQLVTIAATLFAQKGYDGTSLREIAETAGITKAALYYWFPEKEKLFKRVVEGRMLALLERATAATPQGKSPVEKIRIFMLASAEQMEKDRFAWVASSNTFWSNFNKEQREAVLPLRDQYERMLRGYIKEAIQQKRFRDVDPAIAARLLLSGLNYLPKWHKQTGRLTAAQVIEQYLDIALNGMLV
jgi:AcrR family transcriptional regulator